MYLHNSQERVCPHSSVANCPQASLTPGITTKEIKSSRFSTCTLGQFANMLVSVQAFTENLIRLDRRTGNSSIRQGKAQSTIKVIWQTSWFQIFNAQLAVKVMIDGLGFQEIAFNSSVVSERMGGGG